MNDLPFCVFKRSNRPYYFVLFKDQYGKYINKPVSNKKKTEKEAVKVAFEWYREGIPQKETVVKVSDLSLRDVARNIKTDDEAAVFCLGQKRVHKLCDDVMNNILYFEFDCHD